LFEGWTDYRIWKEYRIPIPLIKQAKKEIERQAAEEFENKELHAVDLAKLKYLSRIIIDIMDSIAKDPNVSLADRINSERTKVEALAVLQDAIEASISCNDPHSAINKIVEQSNRGQRQHWSSGSQ
jgi:hypothetical protein